MLKENSRIDILRKDADRGLRISIKAVKYQPGNVVLTLCLAITVLSGIFLIYLMSVRPGNLSLLLPAITALAIAIVARIWLWYYLGEELIEVKDNCLYVKRSYGMYSSKEKYISLDGSIDLYVNRSDNWSWKNMREKGVFRLVKDTETLDFGIKLNDNEYEILLSQINKILNRYKKTSASPVTSDYHLPLPSLAVQLKGQHFEKLGLFYNKYYKGISPPDADPCPLADKNKEV